MRLLVVIPTWNRADYLDKAISAIAAARSRARTCHVELFISDNCSSDRTAEVVAHWQETAPWIHVRRWEEHATAWGDILKRALLSSGLEYDYLWLQGDDDWVSDTTAYTQLMEALEASAEDPPAIVHCCQTRRALPGDGRILAGNTEDLCNTYGWHDLLGWISSLVISRDTVDRMMASPQWEMTAPSAFAHSEALFEAAYGRTMLILTAGFIDPQDSEQTDESLERWAKANVGEGYWRIIPGLLNLRQRGIITTPLTLGFFRYLTYSFWDRFAIELMSLASRPGTVEETLQNKLRLLSFFPVLLGYGEDRKLFENWLEGIRDDVYEVRRAFQVVQKRIESAYVPSYAFSLLPPPERVPEEGKPQPASAIRCKCCDSGAHYAGSVDFNRTCSDKNERVLPLSTEMVPYYICNNCGFIFTNYCDEWSQEEFKERIYNLEYSKIDYDPNIVAGVRSTVSYKNGELLADLLNGGQGQLKLLDFGAGGNPGRMGQALIDHGFDVTSYEPYFSDAGGTEKSLGIFDVIYAVEVFEHCHDLKKLTRFIDCHLSEHGILYFSTLIHPFPSNNDILTSWYIAPRNGHISIFTQKAVTSLFKQVGITIINHDKGWIGIKKYPNFPNQFFDA